jgi:hypothetical protein
MLDLWRCLYCADHLHDLGKLELDSDAGYEQRVEISI